MSNFFRIFAEVKLKTVKMKTQTEEKAWENISKEFEVFYNEQNQEYWQKYTPTYAFFLFLKENYKLPQKK